MIVLIIEILFFIVLVIAGVMATKLANYKNRKNSGTSTVQPEKSTIWSRIKRLLKL